MRTTAILTCVAVAVLVATIATSRSDTGDPPSSSSPSGADPEPITGTVAMPEPGSETPPINHFLPYRTGQEGQSTLWSYQQLGSGDQRVVDRGLLEDYSAVNNAYAAAALHRTEQAKAEAAATALGTDNLATTGVVE